MHVLWCFGKGLCQSCLFDDNCRYCDHNLACVFEDKSLTSSGTNHPRTRIVICCIVGLTNQQCYWRFEELILDKPVCYTVSKILYHWICNSDKGWWPFVQNGVNEVQRLIPADQWRHCPGSYNPVDVPFRGRTLIELMDNHLWFHGPDWLLVNNSEEKDPDVSEITHNLLNTEFYGISNLI